MNRIIYYYFFVSFLIVFFIFGYFSHKYKFKNIYTFVESFVIEIENLFEVSLDNILLEPQPLSKDNYLNNQNFNLDDKPINDFEFPLLLKLDHSNFRLMKNPNTALWNWNLDKFRKPEIIMPIKLFENGDIIVAKLNNKGIYRIDKKGNILWKSNHYFHHWGSNLEEKLFVPSRKFKKVSEIKNEKIKSFFKKECSDSEILFDTILVIDINNGNKLKEISLLEVFFNSEKFNNLFKTKFDENFTCGNILHLNDVIVLDDQKAGFFESGSKGDLLLSFRQFNSLVLIDSKNYSVKWFYTDNMFRQHSPRITNNGTLLIFDNMFKRKGQEEYVSRILEIDIETKKILGYFDDFKGNFYSQTRGRIQIINDRIFVQSSSQGEIFEIKCDSKYVNNKCQSEYLYSAIYSDFYNHNIYNDRGEKNDQMYLGDFYETELLFLKDD